MARRITWVLVICFLFLSGTVSAEAMKIGILDFRKAGIECKKAKEFQKELEVKRDGIQKQFDNMAGEIRKLKDEIELLGDDAREKKETEFREKTRKLNEFRRDKSEELLVWRDDKMREISQDIIDAAEKIAKKNGYDIVVDKMASIYSADKFDITDQILKELNK